MLPQERPSPSEPLGVPIDVPAPAIRLSTLEGKVVSLPDEAGRPVVLAFYPPEWDPARLSDLARHQELVGRLRDQGADLYGISMDAALCRIAAGDPRVEFPILMDLSPPGAAARAYHAYGRQALYVIDKDGIVRFGYIAPPGAAPNAEAILKGLESV